jgi:serine/threonine-protein kinase HipA
VAGIDTSINSDLSVKYRHQNLNLDVVLSGAHQIHISEFTLNKTLSPRYLEIWLQSVHVGWLCEFEGTSRFIATEEYLDDRNRATLSASIVMPGGDPPSRSSVDGHADPNLYRERKQMPPFFAGLMSEGTLRLRLAATRRQDRDKDDFGILAAAGQDLPGAIIAVPADLTKLQLSLSKIEIDGDSKVWAPIAPEGATAGGALLSGVQDKLALFYSHDDHLYRTPQKGELSNVVAKLPKVEDDSQVRNEYLCMTLARLAEINVAQCRLVPMSEIVGLPDLVRQLGPDTHFLAVDRFDRTSEGPVHIEDVCQFLGMLPGQKYAGVKKFVLFLQMLNRLGTKGIFDIQQFFMRQAVNTLIGNSDAHLKNHSVLYRHGIFPELSPAYDIVCLSALPNFRSLHTNVAIDKFQRKETLDLYCAVAQEAGISQLAVKVAVKRAVELALDRWPTALQASDVPDRIRNEILGRLRTLPLTLSLN